MDRQRRFGYAIMAGLLIALCGAGVAFALAAEPDTAPAGAAGEAIIIDHTSTDITAVPQVWIEKARDELHIAYGHTSHGSQLVTGMAALVDFANGGSLGPALPGDLFAFNDGGTDGALDLREPFGTDAGYYPAWVDQTRAYLGAPDPVTGRGTNNSEINVIMWAWCGQVSDYTEQKMLDDYLLPMTELEKDYPGIVFVYMTGHADGTGEEGNLHLRNQQIRDYCAENGKVLYDFYDIELYDPDKAYFGDKAVTDECYYDSDGNGSRDRNWALDWQDEHVEDQDWYACDCAHSQDLNCNQKAYAAWWLWARLAGWLEQLPEQPDLTPSYKTAYPLRGFPGDEITYTIVIRSATGPLSGTVSLSDTIPDGLVYVPGTLTSTAGEVSDAAAPALSWSGILSPTSVVTVTYGVTVDTAEPASITNAAVITLSGYPAVTRTATILVDPNQVYLPLVLRGALIP